MARKCIVCEAINDGKSKKKFHVFPKCRKKLWMKALGIDFVYTTSTVCSDHFSAKDYESSGVLKPTAIPHKQNGSKLDKKSSITDKNVNNDMEKLCNESEISVAPRVSSRLVSARNSIAAMTSTTSINDESKTLVTPRASNRLASTRNSIAAVTTTTSINDESKTLVTPRKRRRLTCIKINVGALTIAYSPVESNSNSQFLRVYCLCGKCDAPSHLL